MVALFEEKKMSTIYRVMMVVYDQRGSNLIEGKAYPTLAKANKAIEVLNEVAKENKFDVEYFVRQCWA